MYNIFGKSNLIRAATLKFGIVVLAPPPMKLTLTSYRNSESKIRYCIYLFCYPYLLHHAHGVQLGATILNLVCLNRWPKSTPTASIIFFR